MTQEQVSMLSVSNHNLDIDKLQIERYFDSILNGVFIESEEYLIKFKFKYLKEKKMNILFSICESSIKRGYVSKNILDIYSECIKFNPIYCKMEIISIIKKKKAYKILCEKTFLNILWTDRINLLLIENMTTYHQFIYDGLEQKVNFSIFEFKMMIKLLIDLQLIGSVKINYLSVFKKYNEIYNNKCFLAILRPFS